MSEITFVGDGTVETMTELSANFDLETRELLSPDKASSPSHHSTSSHHGHGHHTLKSGSGDSVSSAGHDHHSQAMDRFHMLRDVVMHGDASVVASKTSVSDANPKELSINGGSDDSNESSLPNVPVDPPFIESSFGLASDTLVFEATTDASPCITTSLNI
jgi:hypothetical protein